MRQVRKLDIIAECIYTRKEHIKTIQAEIDKLLISFYKLLPQAEKEAGCNLKYKDINYNPD